MKTLVLLFSVGILAGCAHLPSARSADPDALAANLTNADVVWDGKYFGLQATITGSTAKQLLGLGTLATPVLRSMLSDPAKFAAAHVLLTQIEKKKYQVSASHWNNLKVDLHADGSVDLHPEQIETIKAMWNEDPDRS